MQAVQNCFLKNRCPTSLEASKQWIKHEGFRSMAVCHSWLSSSFPAWSISLFFRLYAHNCVFLCFSPLVTSFYLFSSDGGMTVRLYVYFRRLPLKRRAIEAKIKLPKHWLLLHEAQWLLRYSLKEFIKNKALKSPPRRKLIVKLPIIWFRKRPTFHVSLLKQNR